MADLLHDIRYAFRQLRHAPGFTAIAVLTLALGIGANTALFAVVDALLMRPLRGAQSSDVLVIGFGAPAFSGRPWQLPLAAFRALEAEPPAGTARLGGATLGWTSTLQIPGRALVVTPELVSGGYAGVLGLRPVVGRWIGAEDDRVGAAVAVISDRIWREWFSRSPDAIGRTVRLNNHPVTIIGVAAREFRGAQPSFSRFLDESDVWLPLSAAPVVEPAAIRLSGQPTATYLRVATTYLRAADGVTPAQIAASARNPIIGSAGLERDRDRVVVFVDPLESMRGGQALIGGLSVVALSSLILLAACANLANMLFARGARRSGEVAVRLALGAKPSRIFRLFLAETTLIAAAASVLGLIGASAGIQGFLAAFPVFNSERVRFALDLSLDYRVFLYAFAAGALSALLVGVATAWRSSRVPPGRVLGTAGAASGLTPRGARRRMALVAVQITVAFLLVMTAGMFLSSRDRRSDRDMGYDTTRLAAARISLRDAGYNSSRGRAFFDRLLHDLRRRGDIEAAGLTSVLPTTRGGTVLTGGADRAHVGTPPRMQGAFAAIDPAFLDALDLRLVRGRPLSNADRDGAPLVAVVSDSVATTLWPGVEPLGQQVMLGSEGRWLTVVGVSADPLGEAVDSAHVRGGAWVFVPFDQRYSDVIQVVVRGVRPAALIEPLREVVRALDEAVPVLDAAPLDETLGLAANTERAARWLMGSLGGLALGIAVLGIYGVISYVVSTRTREFGIRMALGATPWRVLGQVMDQALTMMLVGLLPGVLVASLGTNVLVFKMVSRAEPNPLMVWVAVPILMLIVGLVAGFVPARRAARTDPNVALREL